MSFPDNPVTGQLHTIGTTEWRWDGEKWIIKGSGATISDVYTNEVGLVQDAKFIEDLYDKVLEPLDKPLFRSQEGVNIALSEIIDNLKSDDVEVKTPEVLLENDESLVADLYQRVLDTTTRPLLGTQESVNIAFTEIIDNLKSDDVEVKTPEVLLDNDESVVADLYQKILDTTTRPLLGTQESVNIAFTEIIDNLKSDDVEVFTPDVKLNDDESVVADLYQKVLETVTPPVLGNQESVNIAFTEIIDNLKTDGANVIIDDSPPGFDPYDPYGGYNDLQTGDLWVDSTNFDLYVWEGDAWVELGDSGNVANVIMSDTPPLNPEAGFLWFDTTTANLYVYTGTEWIETGAAGRISPSSYGSGGGSTDLTGYATEAYVDSEITSLDSKISTDVDSEITSLDSKISTDVADLQRSIDQNAQDILDLQSSDFATESYVDGIVDVQNQQINDLAEDVANLQAGGGGSGGDAPDLSGYATKSYVDNADATLRSDIDNKIDDPTGNKQYVRKKGSWEELKTTTTVTTIPSSPVRGQIYLTSGNEIVIGV